MSQSKPADFNLLLEVFRDGLRYGLIAREEIVAWADRIIMAEDEPDYFFIEVSLSPDTNSLIEVLGEYVSGPRNLIALRALMGLTYYRLIDSQSPLTPESAVELLDHISDFDILTIFEYRLTFEFGEYSYLQNIDELQKELLNFLVIYKGFSLSNYQQWPEINKQVEQLLNAEQVKLEITAAEFNRNWRRQNAKASSKPKWKRFGLLSVPVILLITIAWINFIVIRGEPDLSKLFDKYQYLFFLDVTGVYYVGRLGYVLVTRRGGLN